ncbi:DHHW family protein [Cohnella sp. AR92]|uniref:DHHW family protein n=1 Tax=Cohnella sp. AR92 TaxID=648716 RepID=UPI000F8C33F3|nr:DHHW family protein [Cohnella sp. AR92]RUS45047.1 hypothetical protein ELR57_21140 [Cohnella sp. AR92]
MSARTNRLYVIGFVALLFGMSVLLLLLPKKSFSETENRLLQGLPELSWEAIKDKEFSKDAESYVTDHFPWRDKWVALKSEAEQLRLQQENNGIYKDKDGYLFEKFEEPAWEKVASYAEAVRKFAESHSDAKISFLLAPTSVGLYPERLPWLASSYSEEKVNDFIGSIVSESGTDSGTGSRSVSFLNGFDFLKPAAGEDLYYRTDHHWTTRGAYLAYAAFARSMGWSVKPESDFDIRTVTDSFLGSFHTKSQFSGAKPDTIEQYVPKKPAASEMTVADDGTKMEGLYAESYLSKKDKYSYFLGGVHALSEIRTELAPEDVSLDKLLVVKDSYAHSVLPFLALHVPDIHVIDIRYYNGSIADYMAENDIENVLLLFNTATFVSTPELLKLNN